MNRRLVNFKSFSDTGAIVWIYHEEFENDLGIPDKRVIYLIERSEWERPSRWNWRDLGRFKRTPGLLLPLEVWKYISNAQTNPHLSKMAIYITREERYYLTSIGSMIQFVGQVGMAFLDELTNKQVIGFSKNIFEIMSV